MKVSCGQLLQKSQDESISLSNERDSHTHAVAPGKAGTLAASSGVPGFNGCATNNIVCAKP